MSLYIKIDAVKLLEQSKEEEDDDYLIWKNQITVIFTVIPPCEEDSVAITPFRVPRHRLTDKSHKTYIAMLLKHITHLPSQFHDLPSTVQHVSDATSKVPSNIRRLNVLLKPNEASCYIKCFWHVLGEEFCDVEPSSITTPKKKDTKDCSICLDEVRLGSKGCYLPCSHVFHEKCIYGWFEYRSYSCPLCRCRLVKKIS